MLFFANYVNDVEQVALHFLGKGVEDDDGPDNRERWFAVDAPPVHADYNQGGTYRAWDAPPLEYDADHNFKLNLWSYNTPRFTRPSSMPTSMNEEAFTSDQCIPNGIW